MGLRITGRKERKYEYSVDVGSHLLRDETVLGVVVFDINTQTLNQNLHLGQHPFSHLVDHR